MTQLETVLRRAIAGLDPADREARRHALGDVRAQMLRLLAVYEPPLSAAEIEGKIDELDTIIRRIEAEFAPPPRPAAPPAASDFEAEYEAGEEAIVEDEPEEGPFDLDDDEMEPPDGLEDEPPVERRAVLGRVVAVLLALVIIAAGATFLVYVARQPVREAVEAETAPPLPAVTPEAELPQAEQPPPAEPPPQVEPLPEAEPPPAPVVPEPAAATPAETPRAAPPPAAAPVEAANPSGPVAETLVLFDGTDPGRFRSTADNPVGFEGGPHGGSVRISSSANANGARLNVGPGVYQRIAGRAIRLVVVARAAADSPADTLRFAYQNGRSLSPWSDQKLGPDFRSLTMSWTVPKQRAGAEGDFVLIEPGIPGDGTAADIRSVTIEVLP